MSEEEHRGKASIANIIKLVKDTEKDVKKSPQEKLKKHETDEK